MSANSPFADIQRRNLEAASRLAQLSLSHTQHILSAQTKLAQELINSNVASTRAELETTDPQKLLALRAEHAQKTVQALMQSAKEVAELGNEVRSEFSHLLTEQLAAGNKELSEAFQNLMPNLPGNNMNLFAGVQDAIATTTKAFEQIMGAASTTASGSRKK